MTRLTFPLLALAALLGATSSRAADAASKEKRYSGTFSSVAGKKIQMTMKDSSTGDWNVADDAEITFAKKPKPLSDIHAGDRANVWVSEDGVVHKIQLVAMKKTGAPAKAATKRAGASPAPAAATAPAAGGKTKLGELETVQTNSGTQLILVNKTANSSGSETYSVGTGPGDDLHPDFPVLKGGKKLALADLKAGDKVRVLWNTETLAPIHIEIVGQ